MDREHEAVSSKVKDGEPRTTLMLEFDGLSAASKRIYEIAAKAGLKAEKMKVMCLRFHAFTILSVIFSVCLCLLLLFPSVLFALCTVVYIYVCIGYVRVTTTTTQLGARPAPNAGHHPRPNKWAAIHRSDYVIPVITACEDHLHIKQVDSYRPQ